MTKFETILRLSELKGRLSHILLQEVSELKKEISKLIQDLSQDFLSPMGSRYEGECDYEETSSQDKECLLEYSHFCKYRRPNHE